MFDKKQFDLLHQFQNSETPCVSIYIPTYRAGNVQEDRIRFKNAISDATNQLTDASIFPEKEMTKAKAIEFLSPAISLLENETLWSELSDGLAIFVGENHFSYFVVPIDLPQTVYVHNYFYLRHLLPMLKDEKRFFVLALSQNEVRFFEGNRKSITPVIINDLIPNGMEEMVGTDDNSQNLQSRGSTSNMVLYHGHGGGKDDKNESLKKYFRSVDDGLMEMLHDEDAPMVIYSVDYQIPIYQEISNYSNIHHNHITGNPENDDPVLIHERAWSVVNDYFIQKNETTKNEFNQHLADGKASFSIHDITPAAVQGKVETLFLDSGLVHEWGSFDEKNFKIQIHKTRQPDSICLLDKTAISTFQNGGDVFIRPRVEMPRVVSHLNAVFRF